jgi:hypothetical protein
MPCTDTSDFAKTLVGLPGELLGTPTVGNTLETVTLGDGNNIDHLILLEKTRNLDRLLEQTLCELDLVCDRATVNLNLHEVCLLLAETGLADLGVGEDTDNGAVFANTLELTSSRLATIFCVLLGIASEGLLLRTVPVLVEATLDLI